MTRLAVLPKAEMNAERRWTSPVELNAYDKCPTLTQNERQALQTLAESQSRWGDGGTEVVQPDPRCPAPTSEASGRRPDHSCRERSRTKAWQLRC